ATKTRELPLSKRASMSAWYFCPCSNSKEELCESGIAVTGVAGVTGFIWVDGVVKSVLIVVGNTTAHLYVVDSYTLLTG
ncbi:MAG: hypothetical protein AABY99_04920, partial [Pseudomonadota bacterium]